MELSKEALLRMLYDRGYTITIETKEDTKYITFLGKHSLHPHKLSRAYSTEFTDDEVRRDVVYELLKWTGLKVKLTLEY